MPHQEAEGSQHTGIHYPRCGQFAGRDLAGPWHAGSHRRARCGSGGAGNDTLDGGFGTGRLLGGTGNDVYIVTPGDVVVEGANQGSDTVLATGGPSITLAANVETLLLGGDQAMNGRGNGLGNVIIGNGAATMLYGLGGDDVLIGGTGQDSLTGRRGQRPVPLRRPHRKHGGGA